MGGGYRVEGLSLRDWSNFLVMNRETITSYTGNW